MGRLLMVLAMISVFAVPALAIPTPGLQVVDCVEDPPGSGNWSYLFFACTGDFEANDLHIGLTPAEISEGTVVFCCTVPDLAGYSCMYSSTGADYFFPLVGPWSCVPGISEQYFGICLYTEDESTVVIETWTLDGVPVASFTTLIACSPTSTETSTWGCVKALFR